jgi:hypothetical protein
MGFYPYTQYCSNGHEWSAVFTSYDMRDTGRKACPVCNTTWIANSKAELLRWTDPDQYHKDVVEEKERIRAERFKQNPSLEWEQPEE